MKSHTRLAKAALTGALMILIVVGVTTIGSALHRFTPKFVQVTSLGGGQIGRITAWDPDLMAFESDGNVLGNGNATWQIFLFDLAIRDLAGQSGLTQITFGPYNARGPSMNRVVTHDGASIVFEADGNLCGDPANNCDSFAFPTSGRQIFVWNQSTGTIRQVTRGPGDARNPNLSGNGRFVVFDSATDFLDTQQVGQVSELYQADLARLGPSCPQVPCSSPPPGSVQQDGRGLVRLTRGGGGEGAQSFTGAAVAFLSRGDLANGGANPGIQQVYLLSRGDLQQITFGTAVEARNVTVNQNGKLIAYEHDVLQPDGSIVPHAFVAKVRKRRREIIQVTQGVFDSFQPSLDPKGRRIAFVSTADLMDNGSTGPQIFIYSLRRRVLTQVTGAPRGASSPHSTNAVILGLVSSDDFVGNGNASEQFFVANFFRAAPENFVTPFLGTPTPAPTPGVPANVTLSFANGAQDNGDGTLTTVVAAVVTDGFGDAVPDGTPVDFAIAEPANSAFVTDGATNTNPACDVSNFGAATGVPIVNQPGVAHGCVIYPATEAGTSRTVSATVEAGGGQSIVASDTMILPAAGSPNPTPTP